MSADKHEDRNSSVMVEERELRAMFARRRPDAAKFSAGIAQRLAAAADDHTSGGSDDADGEPGVDQRTLGKQAASLLPAVPATGASGKSLLSTLSLPFVLLVGAVVAFTRGLRGVDPATYRDQPKPSARAAKTNKKFLALLPAIGSLLGIVAMATFFIGGGSAVTHLVTLGLIVGMLVMTWHVGQTARSGVGSSLLIGRSIIMLLVAAVFGCWAWLGSVIIFDGDSVFGHFGVGWVLWLGTICACLLLTIQSRHLDIAIGGILFLMLPLIGAAALELPADTKARVRSHLSTLSLYPEDLNNWSSVGILALALEAAGEPPVDLPEVRERIATAVTAATQLPPRPWLPEVREQAMAEAARVHSQVWSTAARLGLLDRAQLAQLATKGFTPTRLAQLLEQTGALSYTASDDFLLDCLLATRELSDAEREHLLQRIDASWPEPDEQVDGLARARLLVNWLHRLGRRDMIEQRRDDLHALLMRHWITAARASAFTRPGGFCTFTKHPHSNTRATVDAVAIMALVGVPSDLQLNHVRAFLRHSFRTGLLGRLFSAHSILSKESEAAMLLLDEGIGFPERGWLAFLIGERMMIAALLLVLLGLRAIRLAHVSEQQLVGAKP